MRRNKSDASARFYSNLLQNDLAYHVIWFLPVDLMAENVSISIL